jgi:cysteine desulfurase
MRTVYFDYNATTPLDSAVREAMLPFLGSVWGNPSSIHHVGRRARAILDESRDRVANAFRCQPSEVVFTSGGTESNNLAILGTARRFQQKGRHLITSAVEHHAVLHCFDYLARREGFTVTTLPVNSEGIVSVAALAEALRPDTVLVSVMAANNEIGTLQPVAELGSLCQERGVVFHTDAAQWLGKEPLADIHQFNADLVSVCAHKFHGPKGAGALFARSPLKPDAVLFGGGHENERRAGTENLAGIAGLAEAVVRFVREPVFDRARLLPLTERLLEAMATCPGVRVVGPRQKRLANTVAVVVAGADSIGLLAGLDLEGICASSGSACSAGSLEPSHVVTALGLERKLAHSLVRFSIGRETTAEEITFVERLFPEVVGRAQLSQQPAKEM